jgi:hypothetical protein
VDAAKNFKLWTCGGEITPGVACGEHMNGLPVAEFGKAVVFDDHGTGVNARLTAWKECIAPGQRLILEPEKTVDTFAFYESHRTPYPQIGLFKSLQGTTDDHKVAFHNEVLCAALTPVVILDERFQRIAVQTASNDYEAAITDLWFNKHDDFKMGKIWKRMRVHVPSATEGGCNLEEPKADDIIKYLETLAGMIGQGAYIVIHQTIFEKLGNGQEKMLARYLANQAKICHWINVVCSGRGVPWQLQGNNHGSEYRPRFIALSALLQCLEHMPSKVHLVRLLEVTRAPCKR